ncbi:phosphoribosylglycinamide formyltransferase [Alteromonas sp. 5E99-2]|uniref:phosphoribosylglycinamide formyltransferase n=1 Tax=Alteromonas sp. 5E99-2 TaxID=2817683 RepID=UPI001A9936B6|nr:phosphoribosylglycinamide formyltransferase [Alteromonas sp. 5E99-2]MBO1255557.1 phosphoribosylglycinamide formyltransferase [Alteromonas sp. 5E99-2]
MKNIVVLVSGNGSNLQAIIDAVEAKTIAGKITKVISNRPNAFGLTRAENHGINGVCLDHKEYADRTAYDAELLACINPKDTDLVVLAGFMRILSPEFVAAFEGKMLNIHPSLLPKYKGLNTHQRALDNKDSSHGPTVHFVTAELDDGPVVLQSEIPILENESADELAQRVQVEERMIYPKVVKWFCEGRLKMEGNKAILDNQCLPVNGHKDA